MARAQDIEAFTSGVHNRFDKEVIPPDAASDAIGWITNDGKIELMRGRQAIGGDGAAGKVWTEHTAYKTDGTAVRFRKIWDGTEGKVQYLASGNVWTDTITGLSNNPITFSNYSSLAGNAVYLGSAEDGLFKIMVANPGSYADMYNASVNFKGYMFIDKARMIMWRTENDNTGLYGSYIDAQDSDVYTTVSSESIGSAGSTDYSGTLAFKSGGSTRTCFGVVFTDGTQTITIDFTGTATSDSDGTGTVNFMTGAYAIAFTATTTGPVTADYQWENSNNKGVTDFRKSATRLAGEGFSVRQDAGGDPIQVVIPYDGSYFSLKERSVYQFTLDADDTNPTNELIRTNIGVGTLQAGVATGVGSLFLDTGTASEPRVRVLRRNPVGDNFVTEDIFPQFDFSKYTYEDVALFNWDRFLVISCRENSTENNRLLMCDIKNETVDIAPYDVRTFTTANGLLYGGSPVVQTTYELFTGFDDMGQAVTNYYITGATRLNTRNLKKVKKLRLGGLISPNQSVEVSIRTDNGDFQRVGRILGSGTYVNYNSTYAIGTTTIGEAVVGGENVVSVYSFLMEIKLKLNKFREREVRFEALGIGYVSIQRLTDYDIWYYEERLPKTSRSKQNVSLDGSVTNQDTPTI